MTDAPRIVAPAARRVLGMRIDATDYAEVTAWILARAAAGGGGMICCANVAMVMEAWDDPALCAEISTADRVTPDGMPLVWALRHQGVPAAQRVYGPDLMRRVCAEAARVGSPVGFYGGSPETLERLLERCRALFPGLRIAYAWSPPFRALTAEEQSSALAAIEASGARILFVGLGCPKQERWMAAQRARTSAVMIGVGAAFDFLAGAKAQAPAGMQRLGLEWLFRLVSEPRRLWRRYLIGNLRFVYHYFRSAHGS